MQKLKGKPQDFIDEITRDVTDKFPDLHFELKYNPHGDVENVVVTEVSVGEIYALDVDGKRVEAEAEIDVQFSADFSYEDLVTGFYDHETGERFMAEYVRGTVEDTCTISVAFNYSISEAGESLLSDISIQDEKISVREENRGDYGMYK